MKLIFIDDAKNGMTLAKDVVLDDDRVTILTRSGTVLTEQIIQRISESGIISVYIVGQDDSGDLPAELHLDSQVTVAQTVAKAKPIINDRLRDEAIESLKEVFSHDFINSQNKRESFKVVKHLNTVTERLVDALARDTRTCVNIIDLKSYDEYTYHHSLSVAVLTIAVAQAYGLNKSDIVRLGKSAMMHDIGKTSVPLDIIQKSLKLDDRERAIVNNHSRAGYNYLMKTGIFDEDICKAVLCHHEKFDGSGYPCGLNGEAIPLWSRIISVADVYDALTSNRPYRKPMQPAEAVEYIMGGAGSFFDYEVVKAFTKRLEPYPVGSQVELSDGQIAVVINTEHSTRPVVRTIKTGETMDLFNDHSRFNIVINRILDDNQDC